MSVIIAISDTHDRLDHVKKIVQVINSVNPVLVLHAGDWVAPFTLRALSEANARIIGVMGNNDGDKLYLMEIARKFNVQLEREIAITEVEGKRIALLHGTNEAIVDALASSGDYDIVVRGHTHVPGIEKRDNGCIVVNPGELCGYLYGKATYAVINLSTLSVRIEELR